MRYDPCLGATRRKSSTETAWRNQPLNKNRAPGRPHELTGALTGARGDALGGFRSVRRKQRPRPRGAASRRRRQQVRSRTYWLLARSGRVWMSAAVKVLRASGRIRPVSGSPARCSRVAPSVRWARRTGTVVGAAAGPRSTAHSPSGRPGGRRGRCRRSGGGLGRAA